MARLEDFPHYLNCEKKYKWWYYLIDFYEVIKQIYFPLFILFFEILAFIYIAPGKDMMRIFPSISYLNHIIIYILYVWSSLIVWYGSRIVLQFSNIHFINRAVSETLQIWIPRILSALFMFIFLFAIFLAKGVNYIPVVIVYIITSIIIFVFIVIRRVWLKNRYAFEPVLSSAYTTTFKDFIKRWWFFSISFILFVISIICVTISKVGVPIFFTPLGIILLAFACWSGIGIAIKIVDKLYQFPILFTLVLLSVIFSLWNFNHYIKSNLTNSEPNKVLLDSYFSNWVKNRCLDEGNRYPLFIVTAEGGASRSAYWTSGVLSNIQKRDSSFINHVFAISSVSGGTLGSATFSLLANSKYTKVDQTKIDEASGELLKTDFLSSVSAGLLFSDMIQHFIPWKWASLSRANYLESAWENSWDDFINIQSEFLAFKDLAYDEHGNYPLLFMNTTHVESGNRSILSIPYIDSSLTHAKQILYEEKLDLDFSLSRGVSTSAAFPYISPSLRIYNINNDTWGHLVDGGYYENSGILTAVDIYNQLKKHPDFNKVDVYFIIIRAFPDNDKRDSNTALNELLDPGRTLLNTRGQRTPDSYKMLENTLLNISNQPDTLIYKFQLCAKQGEVPVSWYLSEEAISDLDYLLDTTENKIKYNLIVELIDKY